MLDQNYSNSRPGNAPGRPSHYLSSQVTLTAGDPAGSRPGVTTAFLASSASPALGKDFDGRRRHRA